MALSIILDEAGVPDDYYLLILQAIDRRSSYQPAQPHLRHRLWASKLKINIVTMKVWEQFIESKHVLVIFEEYYQELKKADQTRAPSYKKVCTALGHLGIQVKAPLNIANATIEEKCETSHHTITTESCTLLLLIDSHQHVVYWRLFNATQDGGRRSLIGC
jgi:hypothetical protein